MPTILETLANTIGYREGNTLSIKLEAVTTGDNPELRVLITPELKPLPKNVEPSLSARRAALRTPLVITGTALEVEEQLAEHIGGYSKHTSDAEDSLAQMKKNSNKADRSESASEQKGSDTKPATASDTADQTATKASESESEQEVKLGDIDAL